LRQKTTFKVQLSAYLRLAKTIVTSLPKISFLGASDRT
jgi:hypothetical protein